MVEPVIGDAFGMALLSHLERDDGGPHVVERDDGMVEPLSAAPYFGGIDAWAPTEVAAISEIRGRVLDVGAGAGRVSLHLQEEGFDVTALDVSPGALEVCRRRGVRSRFEGTVADLEGVEGYDTFVFFGNNLGLLGSPEGAADLLAELRRLANPGARVIGTTLDPYETTDPLHLAYHEANRARGRMGGHITLRLRYRAISTLWFDLLWTTLEELASLVEPLGWSITDHWSEGPFRTVVLAMG